ncbi:hypothetical protein TrST_g949 [Triparma strigata]|uniref:Uncharacterized protein n=1 Tax=Triparma strigata TaxID=1606541 RepID=A0A9W7BE11_9STRA|nr:hypothetical protein TrST_g949 [Triparma strigata]
MLYKSALVLALFGSTNAFSFTPVARVTASSPLRVSAESADTADKVDIASLEKQMESSPSSPSSNPNSPNPDALQPGRYDSVDYSLTFPALPKPPALDGSHAGDFGFDPLGFTENFDLYYLQECETRHARLAMLAVVGWPLAELVGFAKGGVAPSVMNGFGFGGAVGTLLIFGALGYFDFKTSLRSTRDTKLGKQHLSDMSNIWSVGVAGDYDFDPLNLYNKLGDDAAGRKGMRQLEITQGRYAMLGITAFAFLEKLTGHGVVEGLGSMFFHPNAVLPILGAGYWIWSSIYEVSDPRAFPIKIQYRQGGEETERVLKQTVGNLGEFVNKGNWVEKVQDKAMRAIEDAKNSKQ